MHEKKNTILIVDDEEEIRKMLNIFLDTVDFKVVESDSGKQAIRMATSVKPDLILLDLGLPDMDGKEVVQQLPFGAEVLLPPDAGEHRLLHAHLVAAGVDDGRHFTFAERFVDDLQGVGRTRHLLSPEQDIARIELDTPHSLTRPRQDRDIRHCEVNQPRIARDQEHRVGVFDQLGVDDLVPIDQSTVAPPRLGRRQSE